MIRKLTVAMAVAAMLTGVALAQTAPSETTAPAPAVPPAITSGEPSVQAPAQPEAELKDGDVKLAADPESCLRAAADLALVAEERKVAESRLDKIDDLLIKMERHCDARQFTEAQAVAKDIKSIIQSE